MNERYVYDTKQIYPRLDDVLQFRLSRIKEIEDFSLQKLMAEKNE